MTRPDATVAPPLVLPLRGGAAVLAPALLVVVAVALPAAFHTAGLPVRWLVPMHWPVLLAGLLYGWRAGALTGALAPAVAHAASGYPLTLVLPAMTLELAVYGLVVGALRERARTSGVVAVAVAALVGRAVFIGVAWATDVGQPFGAYLAAAVVPGLAAAAAQAALLPPLAAAIVGRSVR